MPGAGVMAGTGSRVRGSQGGAGARHGVKKQLRPTADLESQASSTYSVQFPYGICFTIAFKAKLLSTLAGLRHHNKFKGLAERGTSDRSTQSLGFLPRVSHQNNKSAPADA
jgi:hypothetical protein